MKYKPSRREFAVASMIGLAGCAERIPYIGDDEDPAREEMLERARGAEAQLLEDGDLEDYERMDNRIIASTYEISVTPIESVEIGEARLYRATGDVELGRNIDDLPGYVQVDSDTLIGKLQEPGYDMFQPVARSLERYRDAERNVHQSRITEYGVRFHGRGDTYALHAISSEDLEDFEDRDDYEEDFEENVTIWNGDEQIY